MTLFHIFVGPPVHQAGVHQMPVLFHQQVMVFFHSTSTYLASQLPLPLLNNTLLHLHHVSSVVSMQKQE
jgi:hypothetical protein